MNELQLQKLVCDVANKAGGWAMKMNNRFTVGVADLAVKLPNAGNILRRGCPPTGFLEVKQRDYPRSDAPFKPEVTHLQRNFLWRAERAGIPCGVVSFLQHGTGSGLTLWTRVVPWRTFENDNYRVRPADHVLLGKKGERESVLLTCLYEWMKEWKDG